MKRAGIIVDNAVVRGLQFSLLGRQIMLVGAERSQARRAGQTALAENLAAQAKQLEIAREKLLKGGVR